MSENAEELNALYTLVKQELSAIELLRAEADASIQRLDGLRETIKQEVTREVILSIQGILNRLTKSFREVIEQHGAEAARKMESASEQIERSAEYAERTLAKLQRNIMLGCFISGLCVGVIMSMILTSSKLNKLAAHIEQLNRNMETIPAVQKDSTKKHHR